MTSTTGRNWVFLKPGEFSRIEFPPITRIPYPINGGNAVGHHFGIRCHGLLEICHTTACWIGGSPVKNRQLGRGIHLEPLRLAETTGRHRVGRVAVLATPLVGLYRYSGTRESRNCLSSNDLARTPRYPHSFPRLWCTSSRNMMQRIIRKADGHVDEAEGPLLADC